MIFGLPTFTFIHVVISLIGILAGFVVMKGLLGSDRMPGWTATFLTFTTLTSVTGFMLPADRILPAHIFGVLSLIALLLAILAVYQHDLSGKWRATYVITALFAQYLNVFVLVVQSFGKIPALTALAPTQSEAPFAIAHLVVLAGFVWAGFVSVRGFRPATA